MTRSQRMARAASYAPGKRSVGDDGLDARREFVAAPGQRMDFVAGASACSHSVRPSQAVPPRMRIFFIP